jgi:chemotaxis protein CheD
MRDLSLSSALSTCERYYLHPGYVFASPYPVAIQTVLGSCVSVCLYDRARGYGGMNHIVYPGEGRGTAAYAAPAMRALHAALRGLGSRTIDLEAQVFGGAGARDDPESAKAGRLNVEAAREYLARKGIPILSEDVLGCLGRKLIYVSSLNRALVYKLEEIRRSDFNAKGVGRDG